MTRTRPPASQACNIYIGLAIWKEPEVTPLLIAGTLLTIGVSSFYTWLKISKVLTKKVECINFQESFEACLTCRPKKEPLSSQQAPQNWSSNA